MLEQERLIARVRVACRDDERLTAALMYGSFAAGEGDAHSDIEFWLFFDPERHGTVDPAAWCERIAPVRLLVLNEFGTHVAFFPGPVRGEFHFTSFADLGAVRSWPARGAAVERMVVKDRGGALAAALRAVPERPAAPDSGEVAALCGRFANWLVLAERVAARGEWLRAWDALAHAQRHLAWLARLAEGRTQHWLTPSRAAERDLPAPAAEALRAATCAAGPGELPGALRAAWWAGRRYWTRLGAPAPADLLAELDALFAPAPGPAPTPPARPAAPPAPASTPRMDA
ncbi:hypothetical protein POF50_013505 [Streptomyces sp. SL13]|uniref:Lincosamide nucleotidyltransferase-like C-terminal domain-containing protein n=1 Tax=Streptantibioticus silvisoli TaxID=2705255 RepID=A0AA90K940_9ACTN|nr:hypothetical protein [Streptantibioticus silvisoli]MDI5970347.1 hypothetical protein [Streptantibioticus silvisoli]